MVQARENSTTTDIFHQLWRVQIVALAVQFMKRFYL